MLWSSLNMHTQEGERDVHHKNLQKQHTNCNSGLKKQAIAAWLLTLSIASASGHGSLPEMVDFSSQDGTDSSPQAKYCTNLQKQDRFGAALAVMWALYQTVVVKRELSKNAKLSVYQLVMFLTLTQPHYHEFSVVTKRLRLWIRTAELRFLRRFLRLSLRVRVQSLDIWRDLRVELLHFERSQLSWNIQHATAFSLIPSSR